LCLPHDLLTTIAGHLWAAGHGSAWSALSHTCVAIRRACDDAVRRVELPPVTPAGRYASVQPLGGRWRRAFDGHDRYGVLRGGQYVVLGREVLGVPVVDVDAYVLTASMLAGGEPSPFAWAAASDQAATVHEPAVADELGRSVAAFLGRLQGVVQDGGRGVRAARFGRCDFGPFSDPLPYSPANAEVLGRLLPHLARCPLDAFVADGWVLRLLGRDSARVSTGRLRTLRLRRAAVGDGPTHWAIASVVQAHAAELVDLTLGLCNERTSEIGEMFHHPTGFLCYWLGVAGGPASPPPPPPPWGPAAPRAGARPPVALPHLRVFSFLGSASAADVAALATAAPRLARLHLAGAVGRGALAALAPPALPELDHLVLHSAFQTVHLRDELPRALAARPPLAVLGLPRPGKDFPAMHGRKWSPAQLWGGRGIATPVELVASTWWGFCTWTYDDAAVSRICGAAADAVAAAADGGLRLPGGGSEIVAPTGVPACRAVGLRSLTIALGKSATDAAVATLAALPALATLRLSLSAAVGVRLGSWPAFPALTRLSLALRNDLAYCRVSAAAALNALSAPPSTAPALLIALRFILEAGWDSVPLPPPLSDDEAGGWPCPPPDLSPLVSWMGLRSLVWESPEPKGRASIGIRGNPSAAEEVSMAATARRVAATLPRVTTVVKRRDQAVPFHSTYTRRKRDDPWGPDGLYAHFPCSYHPFGGEDDGPVDAQAV